MKLNTKNQSGFTFVETMLVLIFVALIGFAGYYAYSQNQYKSDTAKTAGKNAAANEDPSLPNGWRWSDTKEYGFKFAYPEEYGDVEVSSSEGMDENAPDFMSKTEKAYYANFSERYPDGKAPSLSFATEGYYRDGRGSPCNVGGSDTPGKYQPLVPNPEDNTWAISRQIIKDNTITGVERVSYTEDNPEAACMDFDIKVHKQLVKNKKYRVVELYYTGESKQYGKLTTQSQYEAVYKADPDSVIDSKLRDEILGIAKSITEL